MEKRFFHRVDIAANGELQWATKSRVGRVRAHREHVRTINVSIDGAKILVPGKHRFPTGARGRLTLGIESCDVEIRHADVVDGDTIVRLHFLAPSQRFVAVLEKWMPISTRGRNDFLSAWM